MGVTNWWPCSDFELISHSHGNDIAYLCDQRSISGALLNCKHGLFHPKYFVNGRPEPGYPLAKISRNLNRYIKWNTLVPGDGNFLKKVVHLGLITSHCSEKWACFQCHLAEKLLKFRLKSKWNTSVQMETLLYSNNVVPCLLISSTGFWPVLVWQNGERSRTAELLRELGCSWDNVLSSWHHNYSVHVVTFALFAFV